MKTDDHNRQWTNGEYTMVANNSGLIGGCKEKAVAELAPNLFKMIFNKIVKKPTVAEALKNRGRWKDFNSASFG